MKSRFNRFAIAPRLCSCCKRYIFLEPYRREDVYHRFADGYWKENICNECIKNYDVGKKGGKNGN